MPLLLAFSFVIQLGFAYHAIKTGRANTWLYLILIFPGIGCALYFFIEVLPELRRNRRARNAANSVLKSFDPERDLRTRADELKRSGNIDNKLALADECVAQEHYAEADELYRSCLHGIYAQDPNIMEKLARSLFLQGRFSAARAELEQLIAANPDYKSQHGHLLYARTLEALGEDSEAQEEYRVLAQSFHGAEGKCRYALFLKKTGQTEAARHLFEELLEEARLAPAYYRRAERQWLQIAKQNLDE